VSATAYTVTAEALAIGLQFGLDPQIMIDVINTSTGRSFASEVVYKDHVLPGGYATGFQLGLLAKDVGIAADLAETSGVEAPTCGVVSRRWAEAAADQGGAADHAEAHKTWWTAQFSRGGASVAGS
jgi:3-hydroxyisobutyrate dehydrogenase